MNYYLIWTDKGWLKTPIYHHVICSNAGIIDSSVSTTYDINNAYRLDEKQAVECLTFLQRYGVASWAIELREDMQQDVLQELKQKSERSER